jgi:hypothetical protein
MTGRTADSHRSQRLLRQFGFLIVRIQTAQPCNDVRAL